MSCSCRDSSFLEGEGEGERSCDRDRDLDRIPKVYDTSEAMSDASGNRCVQNPNTRVRGVAWKRAIATAGKSAVVRRHRLSHTFSVSCKGRVVERSGARDLLGASTAPNTGVASQSGTLIQPPARRAAARNLRSPLTSRHARKSFFRSPRSPRQRCNSKCGTGTCHAAFQQPFCRGRRRVPEPVRAFKHASCTCWRCDALHGTDELPPVLAPPAPRPP